MRTSNQQPRTSTRPETSRPRLLFRLILPCSGVPGIGKTLTLRELARAASGDWGLRRVVMLNCMMNPESIPQQILDALGGAAQYARGEKATVRTVRPPAHPPTRPPARRRHRCCVHFVRSPASALLHPSHELSPPPLPPLPRLFQVAGNRAIAALQRIVTLPVPPPESPQQKQQPAAKGGGKGGAKGKGKGSASPPASSRGKRKRGDAGAGEEAGEPAAGAGGESANGVLVILDEIDALARCFRTRSVCPAFHRLSRPPADERVRGEDSCSVRVIP